MAIEDELLGVGLEGARRDANCCCIWERPPRGEADRERRLVRLSTGCKPHGKEAKAAAKAAAR